MKAKLFLAGLAAFALLHQDFWLWADSRLAFGFLPSGLAYHAAYSLATVALWALAVRYAWPSELDSVDEIRDRGGDRPA